MEAIGSYSLHRRAFGYPRRVAAGRSNFILVRVVSKTKFTASYTMRTDRITYSKRINALQDPRNTKVGGLHVLNLKGLLASDQLMTHSTTHHYSTLTFFSLFKHILIADWTDCLGRTFQILAPKGDLSCKDFSQFLSSYCLFHKLTQRLRTGPRNSRIIHKIIPIPRLRRIL
jgi:hypothetical protein